MEIPNDKLYRIITIQKGKYQGDYKIYWNRYIAEQFGVKDILNWLNDDLRYATNMQYIESMDGTCVPLLYISRRTDKTREFYFCYFPNIMTYFYRNFKYEHFVKRNFYGNIIGNRHTLTKPGAITNSLKKKTFVSYILSGVNPVTAYTLAFNALYHPSLTGKVIKLMDDKIVRKEISIVYNQFRSKLEKHFTEEELIKEISSLITSSKKGSNTHRENLKFLLELMGKMGNDKLLNATETPYEELPPADT